MYPLILPSNLTYSQEKTVDMYGVIAPQNTEHRDIFTNEIVYTSCTCALKEKGANCAAYFLYFALFYFPFLSFLSFLCVFRYEHIVICMYIMFNALSPCSMYTSGNKMLFCSVNKLANKLLTSNHTF